MDISPKKQKPDTLKSKKKFSYDSFILLVFLFAGLVTAAYVFYVSDTFKKTQKSLQTIEENSPRHHESKLDSPEDVSRNGIPEKNTISPPPLQESISPAKSIKFSRQEMCHNLALKLSQFFLSLDQKTYIKDLGINQPTEQYFRALIIKLIASPPTVTRESDDLYTILTNMAHFFRIIGRQNILALKGILDRERDKIEDIAADLYQWTIVHQCSDKKFTIQAPLDGLYEYAGFFLNTMGGRSYLFRRESRSRLLINYYAILIIDRANKKQMNKYGLDIRPFISRLQKEIIATNQLIYKEDYLDRLGLLQDSY